MYKIINVHGNNASFDKEGKNYTCNGGGDWDDDFKGLGIPGLNKFYSLNVISETIVKAYNCERSFQYEEDKFATIIFVSKFDIEDNYATQDCYIVTCQRV